jgi:hypothetical protein
LWQFLLDVIENVYKLQRLKESMPSLAAGGSGTNECDSQKQLVILALATELKDEPQHSISSSKGISSGVTQTDSERPFSSAVIENTSGPSSSGAT